MKRNNFFSRFIVVTLTAALLLVSGSRAIRVSALADPVPITAVYDTQIIQLADYVDHLPQPSVDIFYILCGVLAAAQLGGQEYKLDDPYSTSDDVLDWFKSLGISLYNTVIGFAPNRDPLLGFDVRPYAKALVAAMMGNAVMARNYNSVEDFMESEDSVLVPFKRDIQESINVIWQIKGGPYNWQFETGPFTTDVSYHALELNSTMEYAYFQYLNNMAHPVRVNDTSNSSTYNLVNSSDLYDVYHNLFIDTSNNTFYICSDSGSQIPAYTAEVLFISSGAVNHFNNVDRYFNRGLYNPANYTKMIDLVHDIFNGIYTLFPNSFYFLEDFIDHVYVGTNWVNKQEIFNVKDLNIAEGGNDYYFETPEEDNYLIDIKNLISDLVDNTDIWTNIINNVYDPDGTQIINPPTIRVSVDLTAITDLLAPPIPVDLNDIAELTDNTYLERVKEHARNAGDIFANYVAFWHNCDSDLVYTMFGAAILVLVGAFVGKWGHS